MAEASPAQIEKTLSGIDYPASKQELIEHAKNSGKNNDDIIEILNQFSDREYNSPVDVNREIGKIE